jgi:hypothetical protein
MRPVILTVTAEGITRGDTQVSLAETSKADLAKAIATARGSSEPVNRHGVPTPIGMVTD